MSTSIKLEKPVRTFTSLRLPIIAGVASIITGAVVFWMYQRSQNKNDSVEEAEEPLANGNAQAKAAAPITHPSEHFEEGEWDDTDESSWESFPASDAPSHSPIRSSPLRH